MAPEFTDDVVPADPAAEPAGERLRRWLVIVGATTALATVLAGATFALVTWVSGERKHYAAVEELTLRSAPRGDSGMTSTTTATRPPQVLGEVFEASAVEDRAVPTTAPPKKAPPTTAPPTTVAVSAPTTEATQPAPIPTPVTATGAFVVENVFDSSAAANPDCSGWAEAYVISALDAEGRPVSSASVSGGVYRRTDFGWGGAQVLCSFTYSVVLPGAASYSFMVAERWDPTTPVQVLTADEALVASGAAPDLSVLNRF